MPQDSNLIRVPGVALAVKQPWAWAIIHAGKDIENRDWQPTNKDLSRRGRVAILASKGMTQEFYQEAADFMLSIGIKCPAPCDLQRGGVIGAVDVVDVVTSSSSRWFFGPRGLVLANPQPCAYVPAVGQLGYFNWTPADPPIAPEPARWMLPKPQAEAASASAMRQTDLLL